MPLQRTKSFGGDFFNLKQLARDSGGSCLVVFRIREYQMPEPAQGFKGINLPVIADALVVEGPRAGEVALAEKFIGGITASLRGVKNPNAAKNERPQEPDAAEGYVVGAELLVRVKLLNPGASNEGAVGDAPSDADYESVGSWYGDNSFQEAVDAYAAKTAQAQPAMATAGAPATNGAAAPASSGGGRPF